MSSQSNRRMWIMLGGLALVCLPLAGCYERVVAARGLGAAGVLIHEPNVGDRPSDGRLQVKEMGITPTRKSSKPW